MATTSPDNLRTPNPGDPYNLVADLATLASDVQVALDKKVSNLLKGTTAERTAATGIATAGMLWQDTDGIKMIWRKDGANWVPAVWSWSGTTAQRTAFTQAPTGFVWEDTTNEITYVRTSTGWKVQKGFTMVGQHTGLPLVAAGAILGPYSVTFPAPFPVAPIVVPAGDSIRLATSVANITTTGCDLYVANWSGANSPAGGLIRWSATW